MESSRWTAALLLILTFALGLSLGFIIHNQLFSEGSRRPPGGPGRPDFGGEGMMPPALRDRVSEELGLTSEQREAFDQILEDHRSQSMALQRDIIRPQMRAISDSTRARVERLLSPDQMRQFDGFRRSYPRDQFRGPPRGRPEGPPGRFNE